MVYIKSILIGVFGAIVAAGLWILVAFLAFLVPVFAPMLTEPHPLSGMDAWVTREDIVISSDSILLAALVGFVIVAGWTIRRSRVVR